MADGNKPVTEDERLVDAALTRFNAAIDREVAERLAGDDALRERLDRIRLASGILARARG